MTWAEEIVDRLAALKLTGMSFDTAWAVALGEYPPRGSEFRGELTLLRDPRERDPVEWLRWACDDAWHDRRPHLAALRDGLQHVFDGEASPASGRSSSAPLSMIG